VKAKTRRQCVARITQGEAKATTGGENNLARVVFDFIQPARKSEPELFMLVITM